MVFIQSVKTPPGEVGAGGGNQRGHGCLERNQGLGLTPLYLDKSGFLLSLSLTSMQMGRIGMVAKIIKKRTFWQTAFEGYATT